MSYGKAATLGCLFLGLIGCGAVPREPAYSSGFDGGSHPQPSTPPASDGGVTDAAPPAPSNDGAPSTPTGPASNQAEIEIDYPVGTHALTLRGAAAGLTWDHGVTLTGSNGVYHYTLTTTAPVEFKPLLDDTTWSRGPNYVATPGKTTVIYPHFTATHGTVKQLFASFSSQKLSFNQIVWVYLPASYDENTLARYPVIYMQDGQNLFDPARAFGGNEWKVDETLDAASDSDNGPPMGAGGTIREIIVIGPEAGPGRNDEYTPTLDPTEGFGGKGDAYLSMLVSELKPQVDMMLRTMPEREHTAILGSSLGGLISAYAGCTHADTFGIIGAMSPSTWWDSNVIISDVAGMKPAPARPLRVYVDSGDSGTSNDDVTQTTMLHDTYASLGYMDGVNLLHVVQAGGQHNEIYWAQRLPGALAFLFGPRQQ